MPKNTWLVHLNSIRKKNPKLTLGEAMILAKKSYNKKAKKAQKGGFTMSDVKNEYEKIINSAKKKQSGGQYFPPEWYHQGPMTGNPVFTTMPILKSPKTS
jgi:hypothetical protein